MGADQQGRERRGGANRGGADGDEYFGDGVAIAVSREDPQLKGLINAALRRMRESGRYEELVLRYFPLRAF